MIIDNNTLKILLSLEALFHEKLYNLDQVNQMLEIYSDFVSYFDNQKSPFKDYFLEKIQFIISRPETISLLKKEVNDELIKKSPGRMRFSVYKRAQVNEMKIQQQLQNDQDNQSKNLNLLLEEYDQEQQNIEKQIHEQLINQDQVLEARKMNRKLKTQVIVKSTSSDNLQQFNEQMEQKKPKWNGIVSAQQNIEFVVKEEID